MKFLIVELLHSHPKKINYKLEGRKNVGKPLTRWEDDFWEEGTDKGA